MRRVWKGRRPGSAATTDMRIERRDRGYGTAASYGRSSITLGGSAMSLRRERALILAAAPWAILIWQSRAVNGMGMGASLFLAIWAVMMIAHIIQAFPHQQDH